MTSPTKMLPNDPKDQVAIALAHADEKYKAAESERKRARAAFDQVFKAEIDQLPPGFHELNNSKFSLTTVEVKNGGTSLDRALMFSALSRHGIKADDINKLLEEGSKPRAGQVIIRCVERSQ